MPELKTSNPALSERAFRGLAPTADARPMTIGGAINRSFILISLVLVSAVWSWNQAYPSGWSESAIPEIPGWTIPAIFGAFILSFVIIFKQNSAPYLAPIYAVLEGLALGAISSMFEAKYPGIASQALLSTFGTFIAMLMCYRSGLIKPTAKFRAGVIAATGGIMIVYVIDMVMHLFGINMPFIHDSGMLGIGISFAIVCVAALNLILDFDTIETAARMRAPKYMEWYCAFGLLVTLVWLYLEILRLLGKGRER